MKWVLLILVFTIALLSLDYSNALWEAQKARKDLNHFTLVKEGIVQNVYETNASCSRKKTSCAYIAVDVTYDDEQRNYSQTTFYSHEFNPAQVGKAITLLCDAEQGICLPRDDVHLRRSLWQKTYFAKLFVL